MKSDVEIRFQFSLLRVFIAIGIVSAFFASIASAGFLGVVLFVGACGVALLSRGFVKRESRYSKPGLALTLLSACTLLVGGGYADGIGSYTLPCTVQVVDAAGNPVDSANVRIRDVMRIEAIPVHPIPAGEPGVSGVTDANGLVSLDFKFDYTFKRSVFRDESVVHVSQQIWVQVDSPGYELATVRLDSLIAPSHDRHKSLPKATIQLERISKRSDSTTK